MVRAPLVVAWMCLGTAASGGWLMVRSAHDAREAADSPEHRLPAVRRSADPFARWTITEQFAALHAIVIQIETRHLDEAESIARRVVESLGGRYDEVLIYIHRPGRPDVLPPRRVQWTRRDGFAFANYEHP